jgi:hypothetical protein
MAAAAAAADESGGAGIREGIARGISQACVFCIEARKSIQQVASARPPSRSSIQFMRNLFESAISSGIVFGAYFTTYHHIGMNNPLAGPIATLVTSVMKTPIGNSMRCVHVGLSNGVIGGGKHIMRRSGLRGLYGGYGLSMIEDMIEFDIRTRLYVALKAYTQYDNIYGYIGIGTISGMIASFVTTPFDTIRANMVLQQKNASAVSKDLFRLGGIGEMYRGAPYRVMSNGLKYALFFMVFELLSPPPSPPTKSERL